jgi:ATP-binding cassette, subfamily C, bacterial
MLKKANFQLIGYFFRSYPRRSAIIVGLLILSGFAEGIGIVSLLPALELALGDGDADSALMRVLRQGLGWVGLEPTLGVLLTLIVAGMFLKGLLGLAASREVGYTVAAVSTDLRLMYIRALLRARWDYFVGQGAGQISNAVGHEAHRASMAYTGACALIASAIQVVLYLVVAFAISPVVAVSAMVAGGVVLLLMSGLVSMAADAGKRQTELIKSLSRRLVDTVQGLKPIKAMSQEAQVQPLLEAETRGLKQAQRREALAAGAMTAFHEPLVVAMLAAGIFLVLTFGLAEVSGLLVIAFVFHRLVNGIHHLQTLYRWITVSESAFSSLRASVEEAESQRELSAAAPPPPLEVGLELRGVGFGYGGSRVLEDVSLQIPAGEFVAIVGPSGAGKTTIADLIAGLYVPDTGEVCVDGISLADVDRLAWRRMIGYVPQEMLLFHESVLHNVSLGDASVDRGQVEAALRAAGAWDFVARLPEGLDTVIGERGAKLSGGQRQRISIARALVRNPRLLILDEATTALDPETEAEICAVLRGLRERVTIIAISHQRAITEAADVTYLLEDRRLRRLGARPAPAPAHAFPS